MEKLSFDQMEQVNGGSAECVAAAVGMGISIAGGLIGLATLQPWGVIMGVAGIYAGAPGVYLACFY